MRIHNARGYVKSAEVTPRIMQRCCHAGWRTVAAGRGGIDKGGCANVLSSARITALAKGNSHQTMLVEVAKA